MLHVQVIRQNIRQIYLLAAILSATGEKNPNLAWNLNMTGLLNVLDIAREEKLDKIYWPSSIAVYGPIPGRKGGLPETVDDDTPLFPTTMYGVTKVAGELLGEHLERPAEREAHPAALPGPLAYGAFAQTPRGLEIGCVAPERAKMFHVKQDALAAARFAGNESAPLSGLASKEGEQLRAAFVDLERGGLFREYGIRNFLEGDFFGWYLAA